MSYEPLELPHYRKPLPQEMFNIILQENPSPYLPFDLSQTLEDKIVHQLTHLGEKVYPAGHFKAMIIEEAYQLLKFWIVVQERYTQIKTGKPKHIQMYPDYNTPFGNQVEILLESLMHPATYIPLIKDD